VCSIKKNSIQLECESKAYIKDLMYLKRNTKFQPDWWGLKTSPASPKTFFGFLLPIWLVKTRNHFITHLKGKGNSQKKLYLPIWVPSTHSMSKYDAICQLFSSLINVKYFKVFRQIFDKTKVNINFNYFKMYNLRQHEFKRKSGDNAVEIYKELVKKNIYFSYSSKSKF
jgi:hypothetical protein